MEQRFYKIRLSNGRVVGPLDLERIKKFIAQEQITGLETARLYPTGDWRDINHFAEIADLLLQKLEGRLQGEFDPPPAESPPAPPPPSTSAPELELELASGAKEVLIQSTDAPLPAQPPAESDGVAPEPSVDTLKLADDTVIHNAPKPPTDGSSADDDATVVKDARSPDATPILKPDDESGGDPEATVMMTPLDEKTVMYSPDDQKKAKLQPEIFLPASSGETKATRRPLTAPEELEMSGWISADKTQVIARPPKEGSRDSTGLLGRFSNLPKKQKIFVGVAVAASVVFLLTPGNPKNPPTPSEQPFKIEMPTQLKPDPQRSESLFIAGLKVYNRDTVDGYREAARYFLQSASFNANNVRALCFLASSYMNLIDVVNRDEQYFNTVTRIIELERAKDLDLAETVLADVELYHILGNPDAAINRIVQFSKSHNFGPEMYYYLALSFFLKGQYPEASKYLSSIDPAAYFSPKVNYLQAQLYEKNGQTDDAIKIYRELVERSPNHVKSRTRLIELLSARDNLTEAEKHADFIIHHRGLSSKKELAAAYYYHARIEMAAGREKEAAMDLQAAQQADPDNPDILLDLYTVRAKLGSKVPEARDKAKMFYFMALGEKALKEDHLDEALAQFLSAREALYTDPAPLLRIAEVFRRKGDMQSAKLNLAKAVKVAPKRSEVYPRYIQVLIEGYEFEEAKNALNVYKELDPPVSTVDKLYGDFYFKQDRLQESLAYYKRALSETNVDADIYIAYANLMFKGNDFRNAAFYYGLARRFHPFNVEATVGIGKALAEIEGLERGVAYVQEALQLSPFKAALLNGIADIYVQKGDAATALKFAQNALSADPTFALAHKTRGAALAAQDKTKEALDAYLTYTNLAPLDPTGQVERYKLFFKKLDLKSSKEAIQAVIENYPRYPGAYYMLGEVYREGQNYPAALEAAQDEIKNNPLYEPAYVLAGRALIAGGEYAKALEALNKALKLNPNSVQALLNAGIANHMLKTYAAAQSMLERAQSLDPGNPQIHKRLGTLYHDLENQEKAREQFKAYLDVYPDAPDRAEIEQYLK